MGSEIFGLGSPATLSDDVLAPSPLLTEPPSPGWRQQVLSLAPGVIVVGLMLVWAVHNGGYDDDTWYWGALILLAAAGAIVIARSGRLEISRTGWIALAAFGSYLAFSYLSIAWSQYPGGALEGSNRTLLYLLAFALMLALPWTPEAALVMLLAFVVGVGVIAIVLVTRFASADHVARLVIGGRLAAPTGYFNSTAALFTIEALMATVLAARRRLVAPLRGLLIAFACASLQLSLIVQSRGWLFTLPLVVVVGIAIVPDRLRVAAASLLPIAAVLAPVKTLLHVYQLAPGPALNHGAAPAGKDALVLCAAMFVGGTLMAWGEQLLDPRPLSRAPRRAIGWAAATLTVAAVAAGGLAATHDRPFHYLARQWRGFSHEQTASSSASHFSDVGSGRYDFWRVALDAFVAHPIGGLGQDNFGDYYVRHRRTDEEPSWPHSIELRLLSQTGIIGFALFGAFLAAAIALAARTRRHGGQLARAVAAAGLLPLIVWLIYGSVDWFWEVPALSGPALGFLGMAGALAPRAQARRRREPARNVTRALAATAAVAFTAALIVLAFPYLSVRETSIAFDVQARSPAAAVRDLARAADLNPLSSDPGRLAGAIALLTGRYQVAEQRFRQSTSREPGGWFAWLGAGLAASAMGDKALAHRYFAVAYSINSRQPAVTQAVARVYTPHPLAPRQALALLSQPG